MLVYDNEPTEYTEQPTLPDRDEETEEAPLKSEEEYYQDY